MKIVKSWIKPTTRNKKGKTEYIKGHYTTHFEKENEQCRAINKINGKRCENESYLHGYCMRHYKKTK